MKIAIAGAGGLIGKELSQYFSPNHQVLQLRHSHLDITDAQAVNRIMQNERPNLIVNCAVIGVDTCESNPSLGNTVNVSGAENLAKAAAALGATFLQFSSNYVFDGRLSDGAFYTIQNVPNPISVYGRTKRDGERAVLAATSRCFIVRTSWVFGSGKENFLGEVTRSLKEATKIRAITDVWASATYVCDLVPRVGEIVSHAPYGTYQVVNSGVCSYYEFVLETARELRISESRLAKLVKPVKVSDLRLPARRPRYSPMRCIASETIGLVPLRDWRAALVAYNSGLIKRS